MREWIGTSEAVVSLDSCLSLLDQGKFNYVNSHIQLQSYLFCHPKCKSKSIKLTSRQRSLAMKLLLFLPTVFFPIAFAFKTSKVLSRKYTQHSRSIVQSMSLGHHPHCDLPGDPSLILTTNVDLGDKKGEILNAMSALVASSTGKPESYVGEIFRWAFILIQYLYAL